jgi:hypothetical protein
MVFLKHFILPSLYEEEIGNPMTSAYPYGIFPFKELENIGFKPIMMAVSNSDGCIQGGLCGTRTLIPE